ncbi:MAG TPA: hypothetical protein ENH09_02090 [Bacteroidetes bacterium]|nr:hypothetical protein [Bacteroidota bacterium]
MKQRQLLIGVSLKKFLTGFTGYFISSFILSILSKIAKISKEEYTQPYSGEKKEAADSRMETADFCRDL